MSSTSAKPIEIAIVGGGMGDTLPSYRASQALYSPRTIYKATHQFSKVGAGVAFGPNALRVMRLISPAVKKLTLGRIHPMRG